MNMKKKTWVIIANASNANIYLPLDRGEQLQFLKSLEYPESREKRQELKSDKSGRNHSTANHQGSFVETTDPKEVASQRFAQTLAKALAKDHHEQQYDELVLFAPPHFHGLLNKALDRQVANCISKHIQKDYVALPIPKLTPLVKPMLKGGL